MRKILWFTVILTICFTLTFICNAKEDTKPTDLIIRPGASVGWIVINQTDIRAVIKHLGDLDGRSKDLTTIVYRNKYGLDLMYDKNTNKVISIMVTEHKIQGGIYKTPEGLHVNSPMESVLKTHGRPSLMTQRQPFEVVTYFDKDRFLTFIGKDGKVAAIWTGMKSAYEQKIEEVNESLK